MCNEVIWKHRRDDSSRIYLVAVIVLAVECVKVIRFCGDGGESLCCVVPSVGMVSLS